MVLVAESVVDVNAYVEAEISPTLTAALVALCREKPDSPVEWLGHYLLANKPQTLPVPAAPPAAEATPAASSSSRGADSFTVCALAAIPQCVAVL